MSRLTDPRHWTQVNEWTWMSTISAEELEERFKTRPTEMINDVVEKSKRVTNEQISNTTSHS
jgi:hypothetical protein